jgi:pyroglutamyl-peptidase
MPPPRRTSRRDGPRRLLVLVTAFGSFEAVVENPSAGIARALAHAPPRGVEVVSSILPVSFARAPRSFDRSLSRMRPRVPDLILGLGVMRERGYRIELRARPSLRGRTRVDVDGRSAVEVAGAGGPPLWTPAGAWLGAYAAAEEGFRVSENAGGYVCERIYHHLLARAGELERPGVFLHVPPERHAPLTDQIVVVRRFLAALARASRAKELGRASRARKL